MGAVNPFGHQLEDGVVGTESGEHPAQYLKITSSDDSIVAVDRAGGREPSRSSNEPNPFLTLKIPQTVAGFNFRVL
jgi:hypothetical protein